MSDILELLNLPEDVGLFAAMDEARVNGGGKVWCSTCPVDTTCANYEGHIPCGHVLAFAVAEEFVRRAYQRGFEEARAAGLGDGPAPQGAQRLGDVAIYNLLCKEEEQ